MASLAFIPQGSFVEFEIATGDNGATSRIMVLASSVTASLDYIEDKITFSSYGQTVAEFTGKNAQEMGFNTVEDIYAQWQAYTQL